MEALFAPAEPDLDTWSRHPDEDVLEEYALNRLSEEVTAPLEEHLLVCDLCQAKLLELARVDGFVAHSSSGCGQRRGASVGGRGGEASIRR